MMDLKICFLEAASKIFRNNIILSQGVFSVNIFFVNLFAMRGKIWGWTAKIVVLHKNKQTISMLYMAIKTKNSLAYWKITRYNSINRLFREKK